MVPRKQNPSKQPVQHALVLVDVTKHCFHCFHKHINSTYSDQACITVLTDTFCSSSSKRLVTAAPLAQQMDEGLMHVLKQLL